MFMNILPTCMYVCVLRACLMLDLMDLEVQMITEPESSERTTSVLLP